MIISDNAFNVTAKVAQKYGKHKIPKYIYHMTTKPNYESMLADGVIKTSKDGSMGNGIFALELTNFFKRWGKNKSWNGDSLQKELIIKVACENDNIVFLQIPTDKLNHERLKIRSQNRLFNWIDSSKRNNIFNAFYKEFSQIPKKNHSWQDTYINLLKKHLFNSEFKKDAVHLTEGAAAKDSHLFKQRKEAIEYVYQDNIPISNVKKIGEINFAEMRKSPEYKPNQLVRSFFTKLLEGTPEANCVKLLTC